MTQAKKKKNHFETCCSTILECCPHWPKPASSLHMHAVNSRMEEGVRRAGLFFESHVPEGVRITFLLMSLNGITRPTFCFKGWREMSLFHAGVSLPRNQGFVYTKKKRADTRGWLAISAMQSNHTEAVAVERDRSAGKVISDCKGGEWRNEWNY